MSDPAPFTEEELAAILVQDANLRDGGDAWACNDCGWCSGCKQLLPCEAHAEDDDAVPRLAAALRASRAEVERLRRGLTLIEEYGDPHDDDGGHCGCVDIAEEALGNVEDGQWFGQENVER